MDLANLSNEVEANLVDTTSDILAPPVKPPVVAKVPPKRDIPVPPVERLPLAHRQSSAEDVLIVLAQAGRQQVGQVRTTGDVSQAVGVSQDQGIGRLMYNLCDNETVS